MAPNGRGQVLPRPGRDGSGESRYLDQTPPLKKGGCSAPTVVHTVARASRTRRLRRREPVSRMPLPWGRSALFSGVLLAIPTSAADSPDQESRSAVARGRRRVSPRTSLPLRRRRLPPTDCRRGQATKQRGTVPCQGKFFPAGPVPVQILRDGPRRCPGAGDATVHREIDPTAVPIDRQDRCGGAVRRPSQGPPKGGSPQWMRRTPRLRLANCLPVCNLPRRRLPAPASTPGPAFPSTPHAGVSGVRDRLRAAAAAGPYRRRAESARGWHRGCTCVKGRKPHHEG